MPLASTRGYPCRMHRSGARVLGLPRGKTLCADRVCVSDLNVHGLTAQDATVDSLDVKEEAAFKRMVVGEPPPGEGTEADDADTNLLVLGATAVHGDGTSRDALSVDGGDLVLAASAAGNGGVLRAVQDAEPAGDGPSGAGVRLDVIFDDAQGCGRFLDESPRSLRRRGAGFTSEVKAMSVFMACPISGLVGVLRSAVPSDADTAVLQSLWTVPFTGEDATGMFVRHSHAYAWSPWRELAGRAACGGGPGRP